MIQENSKVVGVAGDISLYLEKHPAAADSSEGIAKWWLAVDHYETALNTVELALTYLVDSGRVNRHKTTSGKTIYSICRKLDDQNKRC